MNSIEKLKVLAAAGKYDICSSWTTKRKNKSDDRLGSAEGYGICQSVTPSGCANLLKTLMTNACIHDCKYCVNSLGCKKRISSFEPRELSNLFINFYLRNYVEGLFLSSGVMGDAEISAEKIIETARILRREEKFEGYIHLKVMPGVSRDKIKEASELADRLSINIEAPNRSRFSELTSTKDYKIDILRRLSWIKQHKPSSGHTTQLVVGAAGESDKELIKMMRFLYEKMELSRVYFSSFTPVENTPLEKMSIVPRIREHRLYQADWLMRFYNFSEKELLGSLDDDGFLNLKKDPKEAIAEKMITNGLDVNRASYDELLRVPGIGLTSAKRIINMRKNKRIETLKDFKRTGAVMRRAAAYIKTGGEKQVRLNDFAS